jgi:hypothetical protein
MSAETAQRLRGVLGDPAVAARYREKVVVVPPFSCRFWVGAVTGKGHGRLWIAHDVAGPGEAKDFVVIAHRFGYGLAHGFEALMDAEVIAHLCDNTLCQEPSHWQAATHAENKRQWAARRHQLAGPLRDSRGARARALAIREAVLTGRALPAVFADGVRPLDRDQLPLWG